MDPSSPFPGVRQVSGLLRLVIPLFEMYLGATTATEITEMIDRGRLAIETLNEPAHERRVAGRFRRLMVLSSKRVTDVPTGPTEAPVAPD